jgi:hypothetical protein
MPILKDQGGRVSGNSAYDHYHGTSEKSTKRTPHKMKFSKGRFKKGRHGKSPRASGRM